MEHLHALLLLFLEATFIFIALTLLLQQRGAIGRVAFIMCFGVLQFFTYFIAAADLNGVIVEGISFSVAETVFFVPLLASFLMVYISSGTLSAQRMIIGIVSVFGLYFYIGEVSCLQCSWLGFSFSSGISGIALETLLRSGRDSLHGSLLRHLAEYIFGTVCYALCGRLRWRRGPRAVCALFGAQLFGAGLRWLFARLFAYPIPFLSCEFAVRLVLEAWIGVLIWLYFAKLEAEQHAPPENSPFDLIFAFLGGFGRSQKLEAALRDWTNRYQLILTNAMESVMMIDARGRLVDTNPAAGKLLRRPPQELQGIPFADLIRITEPEDGVALPPPSPCRISGETVTAAAEEPRRIAASLSPIRLGGETMTVMVARDITEELRLARERRELAEQLAHSQRLESLGMLAGGVAHDFNNYIHAMLGHIDVINFLHPPQDPEVVSHLAKITSIAEQAGRLTSQLLGFARKGKYAVTEVNLPELIGECLELLGTRKLGEIEVIRDFAALPDAAIRADRVQMQQVLINLILNAADALAGRENPELRLRLLPASATGVELTPPAELKADPAAYLCFECTDNGCGMDEATMKHLFEPFFTTKPVGSGTGMGLAMIYGTVTHHHGWLQVESSPGRGTTFRVFLPRSTR